MFGLLFLSFVLLITNNLLIYFPPVVNDPFLLEIVARLMVDGQFFDDLALVRTHYGSTVAHVSHIALVSMEKCHNGA